MIQNRQMTIHSNIQKSLLSALSYYALFGYPLLLEELHGNLSLKCEFEELQHALDSLLEQGEVFTSDGFYSLSSDIETLITKRKSGNQLALLMVNRALKTGHFIGKFPFVRFVGISGSLSKGYADERTDFDFFIITEKNRLWICRTLLHLYKKTTFLTGRQHQYCMNYFIDTTAMEIEQQNRYTSIELASLIPACGSDLYEDLLKANSWMNGYLPNQYHKFFLPGNKEEAGKGILKPLLEKIISLFVPDRLNVFLMKITDLKWKRKWAAKHFPMEDYDLAFRTTLHISKNHPANYQKKVLEAIAKFED